jgi:hypothetical protein
MSFVDSTLVQSRGYYGFGELEEGDYTLYAALPSGTKEETHVSSLTDVLEAGGDRELRVADLWMQPVTGRGVLTGGLAIDDPIAPADSAHVMLHRLRGAHFELVAEVEADAGGVFTFGNVATGNYRYLAWWSEWALSPFPAKFAESAPLFSDGETTLTLPTLILVDDVHVDKPAIYIYPEEAGRFRVELTLAEGVAITASDPDYGDGWDVFVETDGRIDGVHDYLFYEADLPAFAVPAAGWCLGREGLADGLDGILAALGLVERERREFLDYWLAHLPDRPWYDVRLLPEDDVDALIGLAITPPPASVRRVWLGFRGLSAAVTRTPPELAPFARTGTTVVEWGGFVVR